MPIKRSEGSSGLVLVTGGAGYVGSHTLVELLNANFEIVCVDNCINAICSENQQLPESIKRVQMITQKRLLHFERISLLNQDGLKKIFQDFAFDAVIHFAGLKAVGESCKQPLRYYSNNVTGTLNLLHTMQEAQVAKLLFSSSCTVYGNPRYLPVDEMHPIGQNIINPYGRTKFMIEEILKDCALAESSFGVTSLRYFNPIGAHPSGLIGEHPHGVPNNIMPYITQVAVGKLPYLNVFGTDFDTVDGTGVRDYIHVMDLARGHVSALNKMLKNSWVGFNPINLGTGRGYSVLELVDAFEKATSIKIPYKIVARRAGDIDKVFADAKKAKEILGWQPIHSIEEMCKDVWKWQSTYPTGFECSLVDEPNNNVSVKNGKMSHTELNNNLHHLTDNNQCKFSKN